MATTSINLLPPEILLERRQSSKLSLVNKLSFGAIILLFFITSATLALRLSQQFTLKEAKENLVHAQENVSTLRDKEGQYILLKQRLGEIQELSEGDVKKRSILNLLLSLVPPEVQLSEFTLDNRDEVIMSMESSSLLSLNKLVTDLSDPEKNLNLISRVDLENLALMKSNAYTLSLRVISK